MDEAVHPAAGRSLYNLSTLEHNLTTDNSELGLAILPKSLHICRQLRDILTLNSISAEI